MDALTLYRQIVETTLKEFINIQYAYGNIQNAIVFDHEENRYLVMSLGWHNTKRIHGCLIHIDIANGKVWIQRDGTEHGIAKDLERAGIPKQDIVLGFHPADVRKHTEYAVA